MLFISAIGENSGRPGQAVYNAMGLKIPESIKKQVDANDEFFQLSKEALPDYSADYMFMTVYDPEKKGEAIKQLTGRSYCRHAYCKSRRK